MHLPSRTDAIGCYKVVAVVELAARGDCKAPQAARFVVLQLEPGRACERRGPGCGRHDDDGDLTANQIVDQGGQPLQTIVPTGAWQPALGVTT
jgi:hypothetical protein